MTSPPDAERRPGRSGVQKVIAATGSTIAQAADSSWDSGEWMYRLGWAACERTQVPAAVAENDAVWNAIIGACTDTFRQPRHDELEQRRTFDWQPCPRRCRACSRCIASEAYWRRGGHPYPGVQAAS